MSTTLLLLQAGDDYGIDAIDQRIARGRYLGQSELAGFVADWAAGHGGAATVHAETQQLIVDLSQEMREVIVEWRRSLREAPGRIRELEISPSLTFSLDPDQARTQGMRLLNGSHPLVRAITHSKKEHRLQRFGNLRARAAGECEPGLYAVAIASVQWQGIRPTSELWVQAIDLETGERVDRGAEATLFAALADGELHDSHRRIHEDFQSAIEDAFTALDERRVHEEGERRRDNDALTAERRIRAERARDRRLEMVEERLRQNRITGNVSMNPAILGQARKAEQRYNDEISLIESHSASSLGLDHVAICQLLVVPR